jgi:uncharacterized membrane protein YfcA
MDGIVLAFFLGAAFVGGVASGLAGFAMGFVVSGVWLHILTPVQTTALIVGYGLLTQGYGVWRLRHALIWKNIAPFIIGGIIGVPIGTLLLTYVNPTYLRVGGGALLVIYGIYGLAQPAFKPVTAGVRADLGIGLVNGVLAGLTGLPGFIITVSVSYVAGRRIFSARYFSRLYSLPWQRTSSRWWQPMQSRPISSGCICSACLQWPPGYGRDSNSTANLTTLLSARSSLFCCW